MQQHRSKRLAAEDVDVEMGDLLAGALADIAEQPIALDDELLVARDLADGADEAGDFLIRGFGRKIVPGDVGPLGNDQDVDRRKRVDVVEGERPLVLIDLLAGKLSAKDPG